MVGGQKCHNPIDDQAVITIDDDNGGIFGI